MAEFGYLVISDITGYTAYLSEADLEHAQDILTELMTNVLEATRPPLIVSRLEGDAIFSYAPEKAFLHGMILIETLENIYTRFRETLRQIQLNTTCDCSACTNIPNLDLKHFVHAGVFTLQKIGAFTELIGNDVNLLFRLTKNSIPEATGLNAYTAISARAVQALGIERFAGFLTTHRESYEHVGAVEVFIQDMHAVWERTQHDSHILIEPEDAYIHIERTFPTSQTMTWEALTNPTYRRYLLASDSQEFADLHDGRIATGTTYICYHGDEVLRQTILDWHPFRYYTFESPDLSLPVMSRMTVYLTAQTDSETLVSLRIQNPEGSADDIAAWQTMIDHSGVAWIEDNLRRLGKRFIADLQAGHFEAARPARPPTQVEIKAAVLKATAQIQIDDLRSSE